MTRTGMKKVDDPSNASVYRPCENRECLIGPTLTRIPRRKTPHFVINPVVQAKPLLVNKLNSVFQVDGISAKLSDIQSGTTVDVDGRAVPPVIYRIIPDSHAHITNYVVVEDDNESMRKLNSGDPFFVQKLLEAQVTSAEKMLLKLMTEEGTTVNVSYSNGRGTQNLPSTSTSTSNSLTATRTAPDERPTSSTNAPLQKKNTTSTTSATTPLAPLAPLTSSSSSTTTSSSTTSSSSTNTTTKTTTPLGVLPKMPIKLTSIPTKSLMRTSTTATTNVNAKIPPKAAVASRASLPAKLPVAPIVETPPQPKKTTTTITLSTPKTASTPITGTPMTTTDFNKSFGLNSDIKITRRRITPSATAVSTAATITTRSNTPLIKTVPLSQLQKPSVQLQTRPFTSAVKQMKMLTGNTTLPCEESNSSLSFTSPTYPKSFSTQSSPSAKSTDDSISIGDMKKELDDLRRTVADLAAIHSKTVPKAKPKLQTATTIMPTATPLTRNTRGMAPAPTKPLNQSQGPRPKRTRLA